MRKLAAILTVTAVALAGCLAAGGAQARSHRQGARIVLDYCRHVGPGLGNEASFTASMDARPGAVRMALRLDLFAHRRHTWRYHRVVAPGLGVWRRSHTGVRHFAYTQRLTNLAARTRYRVRARFAWLDAAGAVVARARDRIRPCSPRRARRGARDGRHAGQDRRPARGRARVQQS